VLDYIRNYIREHEMSPTQKEIADALQMKTQAVNSLVKGLAERGQITRRKRARSIELARPTL
jgi:DNA-binding MarR family transcriptional regulator